MRSPFKTKSGSAAIQAEIDRLRQKLTDNENRHSTALQALVEAQTARRAVLGDDDAIVDQASAKVHKAQTEVDDIAKLVEEYRDAISDAEDIFRQAASVEKTQTVVDQLEAIAKQMDAQAPALQKAVASVAEVFKLMMAAMPTDFGVYPTYNTRRPGDRPERNAAFASPREAAAAIVIEALLGAVPEIFDLYRDGGYRASLHRVMSPTAHQPSFEGDTADYRALSPAAAIAALVSDRARDRAAKILAGELDPDLSAITPVRKQPVLSVVSEEVEEVRRALG
jgi:hypothetical protein